MTSFRVYRCPSFVSIRTSTRRANGGLRCPSESLLCCAGVFFRSAPPEAAYTPRAMAGMAAAVCAGAHTARNLGRADCLPPLTRAALDFLKAHADVSHAEQLGAGRL